MSSDSTSDDVDEIVESNIYIPTESSKLFKFPCADYGFLVVLSYLLVSHLSS